MTEWVNANPEAAKQVSGLLGGAAKSYGDQAAEEAAWENRRKYQQWMQQRYSDSVRNLTVPMYRRGGILGGQGG
jgi:hypothetical protein